MVAHQCYFFDEGMKVWHIVSNFHRVMTVLVVELHSKCCCGDFSAITLIHSLTTSLCCVLNIQLCEICMHFYKVFKSIQGRR
jgi:hypothetical protein